MDPITLEMARTAFVQAHKTACERIHALVIQDTSTTNNDWLELKEARKAEHEAAGDLMRLNQVLSDLKKLCPTQ